MLQSCKSVEEATELSAEGQATLQLIEDSPKPFVSAIMGLCLGGGLEVCCVLLYVIYFFQFTNHFLQYCL